MKNEEYFVCINAQDVETRFIASHLLRSTYKPQRGGIFIANAVALKMSPSGATHIRRGVAPLGLNADYRLALL
jgi:hypothetical protein